MINKHNWMIEMDNMIINQVIINERIGVYGFRAKHIIFVELTKYSDRKSNINNSRVIINLKMWLKDWS